MVDDIADVVYTTDQLGIHRTLAGVDGRRVAVDTLRLRICGDGGGGLLHLGLRPRGDVLVVATQLQLLPGVLAVRRPGDFDTAAVAG